VSVKPANFFEVGDGTFAGDNAGGKLISPHYTVVLEDVLVTDRVPADVATGLDLGDGPVAAADGYEMMLVKLSPDDNIWTDNGSPLLKGVSAAIRIDDRDVKLEKLPDSVTSVAMSVPKGKPVSLRVTDAGRTQSLNLRDGKPGPDVHPGFADIVSGSLSIDYRKSGTASSAGGYRRPLEVTVRLYNASRHPWTPQTGWAKDGRRWVYLGGLSISSDGSIFDLAKREFSAEYKLDIAKTFTLQLPDGTSIRPVKGGTVNTFVSVVQNLPPLVFDVPATFITGKLRIAPDGQIAAQWRDGDQPASWTKKPPAQEYPIKLG